MDFSRCNNDLNYRQTVLHAAKYDCLGGLLGDMLKRDCICPCVVSAKVIIKAFSNARSRGKKPPLIETHSFKYRHNGTHFQTDSPDGHLWCCTYLFIQKMTKIVWNKKKKSEKSSNPAYFHTSASRKREFAEICLYVFRCGKAAEVRGFACCSTIQRALWLEHTGALRL